MSKKFLSVKRIENDNTQVEIDDSKTFVVEIYHRVETLKALATKKLSDVKCDKELAFNATSNNSSRLMKQVRAYNRKTCNVYYHIRQDLTHYVVTTRKLHVARLNKTEVCNRLQIFHLYAVEKDASFEAIKEAVKAL